MFGHQQPPARYLSIVSLPTGLSVLSTSTGLPTTKVYSKAVGGPVLRNSNSQQQRHMTTITTHVIQTTTTSEHSNNKSSVQRYKTELCRSYHETGLCKYGDKCQFAHGTHEIRTLNRHPKYKTVLCRTYHCTGYCPYGPRCHFLHDECVDITSFSPNGICLSSSSRSISPMDSPTTSTTSSDFGGNSSDDELVINNSTDYLFLRSFMLNK